MPKDRHLFSVTRWLLKAAMVFCAFIVIVLGLAFGVLLVLAMGAGGHQLAIPADLGSLSRTNALIVAGYAVACGLACALLTFFLLRMAARLVDTAISSDPFVAENATRLVRIGWLLLGLEAIGIFAHPVFDRLVIRLVPEHLRGQVHFNIGFDMWPIGLLAILMIFVLAQIFRRGSDMRAELEATI